MMDTYLAPSEYETDLYQEAMLLVAEANRLIKENPALHDLKEEMVNEFRAKNGDLNGLYPEGTGDEKKNDLRVNALFDLFIGEEPIDAAQFDTQNGDVEQLIRDFIERAKTYEAKE